MGRVHRSKRTQLSFAVAMAGVACHNADIVTRVVTMHVPPGCPSGGQVLDGSGYVTLEGLGDFEPTLSPSGHLLKNVGDTLSEIDPASQALEINATEGAGKWLGVAAVPAQGSLDVLLLPFLSSCPLPAPMGVLGPSVPVGIGGSIAFAGADRVMAVGGVAQAQGGAASETFVAHLDTDVIALADPQLLTPRTQASVTPFGTGALVAGGTDPRHGTVLDNAEVYAANPGGFQQQPPILLSEPRSAHGAAVLVTGETLLVGGLGGADGKTLLASMEVIDPVTSTVRAENVAALAVPRQSPTVLRLASGEILVAGGFDAAGNAIATLEWFSPDASMATKRAIDLATGSARTFAALGAGGALAVVAPPPMATADFQSVWVIDADGSLEAAQPIVGPLSAPVFFGGAGDAPALWTGDRWLRWQPWVGAFAALGSLDTAPPHVGVATTSADRGLALWLDSLTSALTGLRFDSRGPFSPLAAPLLVTDANDVAPDRLVGSSGVTFDPATGLVLVGNPNRTVAPGAFVTDRTYADVALDVDAPTGEPAVVALRDELGVELDVGGSTCPVALAAGVASSLHVERHGSTVTWRTSSGASGTCTAGVSLNARLSLGLRVAPNAARSVARNLRVVRL
jgi:hypothetical protein